MPNTIRIKRRAAGGAAGAPASLENAELAYNEQDDILYYGKGTGGAGGTATTIIPIAGVGGFLPKNSPAMTGTPTAPTAAVDTNNTQVATTGYYMGQKGSAAPLMAGVASAGTSVRWAPIDHVHPTDTSRAPLASPAFTGTPTAPTAGVGTNTTQVASTAFVIGQAATVAPPMNGAAAVGAATKFAREDHVHPTDTSRAPLASPALTGTPTAPTATAGNNSTQLANTAFVMTAIANIVQTAPAALDSLTELAAALGNDANFATTTATNLGTKASRTANLSDLSDVSAARANLGLASMCLQGANAVAITGGTINGISFDGGTY